MVGPSQLLLPACDGCAGVEEVEANETAMAAVCQVGATESSHMHVCLHAFIAYMNRDICRIN